MAFPSITFIFFFLPLTLFCYYQVPMKWKNHLLFAASLLFYAWGDPASLLLLLFCLIMNYYTGIWLERQDNMPLRRLALTGGLTANLFIWSSFRFLPALSALFPHLFTDPTSPLPLGLSFYTLQGISYLIDIYRGEIRAQGSFTAYGVYIAMFPKILGGPLVRYADLRRELAHRSLNREKLADGIWRFCCGLGKKVLLADTIAGLWLQVQATPAPGAAAAWLGMTAFAFALYFDLSGVCDMAVGLGKMLGFSFPESFHLPYTAASLWDFSKRWFGTLTGWFRDYFYRPLKGKGGTARKVFLFLAAGVLMGIWYGRGWQFALWGLYSALLLAGERYFWGKKLAKAPRLLRQGITFLLILLGWVFFSAESVPAALGYFAVMFGTKGWGLGQAGYLFSSYWLILILCILAAGSGPRRLTQRLAEKKPALKGVLTPVAVLALMVLCTACLVTGGRSLSWFMRP